MKNSERHVIPAQAGIDASLAAGVDPGLRRDDALADRTALAGNEALAVNEALQ